MGGDFLRGFGKDSGKSNLHNQCPNDQLRQRLPNNDFGNMNRFFEQQKHQSDEFDYPALFDYRNQKFLKIVQIRIYQNGDTFVYFNQPLLGDYVKDLEE
jgi:hypothetical protein